jgi:hypothetical protein
MALLDVQDSLSGGSKVVMVLAVNPTDNDAPETFCSLSFAARLRGLEFGPARRNTTRLSIAQRVVDPVDAWLAGADGGAETTRSARGAADKAQRKVEALEEEVYALQEELVQTQVRAVIPCVHTTVAHFRKLIPTITDLTGLFVGMRGNK